MKLINWILMIAVVLVAAAILGIGCGDTGPLTIVSVSPSNLVYTSNTGTASQNVTISVKGVPADATIEARLQMYIDGQINFTGVETFVNNTPFSAFVSDLSMNINTNIVTASTGTWSLQLKNIGTGELSNKWPGTVTIN